MSNHHLAEAEGELRAAVAVTPDPAEVHFLLGKLLFLENRPQESLAEYTAGASGRSPTAEDLMTVASDYVILKDLPDADRWLNDAVKLDPVNPRAWYLLGRTQYNEDRAVAAERSFQHVLALHPQDVRAEYNLGLVEEKLQRPQEALTAYRTAIEWQRGWSKQDAQPYLDLGILLLSQGNANEALSALREAVRYSPDNPLAQQELGQALEALQRFDEALQALQRAISLAPEAQQPHFFMARILKHMGRNEESAAEYAIVAKMLGSHSDTPTPNVEAQPSISDNPRRVLDPPPTDRAVQSSH